MRPEGRPPSTHGPSLKDCDGHLSMLVSSGDVCPSPDCLSPAAEPRATTPSCTAQHRPSPKIPLFLFFHCVFEEGNLAFDQNK